MTDYALKLDLLDYPTLIQIQRQATELIQRKREEARKEAQKAMLAVTDKYGFSLEELAHPPEKARSPRPPKYRNPETGEEWSGKGRDPKWLRQFIEAGRSKEEFVVGQLVPSEA